MRCLSAEQVAACSGREEGAACTVSGAPGACRMGACEPLVCGDGVQSVGEACDGIDFGGKTCRDAGFYEAPGLQCTSFCTFEVSACEGFCGDEIINGPELCDGVPPQGTCTDFGYDAGPVRCGESCSISFASCARFGWVPETTTLQVALEFDALDPQEIWIAGENTTGPATARYDGTGWTQQPLTGVAVPRAIEVTAPGDAWMIRDPGTSLPHLERFVGGQWQTVAGTPAGDYADLWSLGPDALYVATRDVGVLLWNGSTWQTLGTITGVLETIDGISASDLWVARADGTLEHWDGQAWAPVVVDIDVKHISPLPGGQLWAVGPSTTTTGASSIGFWDGVQWTIDVDPAIDPGAGRVFTAIVAHAANDVWVAGPRGEARHFDGYRWSPTGQVVVDPSRGSFDDLRYHDDTALAYTLDGLAYRYRGQAYGRFNTGSTNPLIGSVGITPINTVAVDNRNGAYHYNGAIWSRHDIDLDASPQQATAVWGDAPDNIWIGGSKGRVFRYDGIDWINMNAPTVTTTAYRAIVGFGASDVWIFGGTSYHYDGNGFTLVPVGGIYEASGSATDNIWALANATVGTLVWHWNGSTWTSMTVDEDFSSIVAFAPNNVFATAGPNEIWHWDGTSWTGESFAVLSPFVAIAGTGPRDVFAQTATELLHFDGARWSFIRPPEDPLLFNRKMRNIIAYRDRVDIVYDTETTGTAPFRRLIRTRPWICEDSETFCTDGVDDDCDNAVDDLDSDCP